MVCGSGLKTTDDHGDNGSDIYALWRSPRPMLARRVLKDGFATFS
jgi:hypothetical protein